MSEEEAGQREEKSVSTQRRELSRTWKTHVVHSSGG